MEKRDLYGYIIDEDWYNIYFNISIL